MNESNSNECNSVDLTYYIYMYIYIYIYKTEMWYEKDYYEKIIMKMIKKG